MIIILYTRYFAVLENKFTRVWTSHSKFVQFRTSSEPFKRLFYYKGGNPMLFFSIWICSGIYLQYIHDIMELIIIILHYLFNTFIHCTHKRFFKLTTTYYLMELFKLDLKILSFKIIYLLSDKIYLKLQIWYDAHQKLKY